MLELANMLSKKAFSQWGALTGKKSLKDFTQDDADKIFKALFVKEEDMNALKQFLIGQQYSKAGELGKIGLLILEQQNSRLGDEGVGDGLYRKAIS